MLRICGTAAPSSVYVAPKAPTLDKRDVPYSEIDVPATKINDSSQIPRKLHQQTCEPKCEGVTRSRTTVRAIAVRIRLKSAPQSDYTRAPTPTTCVKNRGAFIVHDNS